MLKAHEEREQKVAMLVGHLQHQMRSSSVDDEPPSALQADSITLSKGNKLKEKTMATKVSKVASVPKPKSTNAVQVSAAKAERATVQSVQKVQKPSKSDLQLIKGSTQTGSFSF